MKTLRPVLRVLQVVLLLLQAACIGTTPPSQFYLLEPLAESQTTRSASDVMPMISIVPVRMPGYLDRPQIVTGTGKNTYQVNELHRWAEALDGNVTRVLAQDLRVLVPADVVLTTTNAARQAQFRLMVTILEFHIDPQGQAGLIAQWQINRGERIEISEQSRYRVPVSSQDYGAMVAGLNQCLNALSMDVAAALKALSTRL